MNDNSRQNQASTFMHELGHTLGLRHGGRDDINNKPNFFSVMNYAHAFPGDRYILDYSRRALATLDEGNLDEAFGLGMNLSPYEGRIFIYNTTPVVNAMTSPSLCEDVGQGPKDWNGDFDFTDTGIQVDINNIDGQSDAPDEILVGAEDWSRLLIPLRGGNGNYGFLTGSGFETGGGDTTASVYGGDKPAAFPALIETFLNGGCAVDLDADGVATAFDVIIFIERYDAADVRADFDRSGVIDEQDLDAYVAAAEQGC